MIVELQTSRRFVSSSGPRAQSRNSDFQFLYEARVLQHPAAPGTLQHPAADVCRAAAGEEGRTTANTADIYPDSAPSPQLLLTHKYFQHSELRGKVP